MWTNTIKHFLYDFCNFNRLCDGLDYCRDIDLTLLRNQNKNSKCRKSHPFCAVIHYKETIREKILYFFCVLTATGADPGFGQGGRAPASEAESCRHSEAESCERSEHSVAGVQGPLKGTGSFWVFDASNMHSHTF